MCGWEDRKKLRWDLGYVNLREVKRRSTLSVNDVSSLLLKGYRHIGTVILASTANLNTENEQERLHLVDVLVTGSLKNAILVFVIREQHVSRCTTV